MLYGTTKQFLLHFGLKDLEELPRIEEFAEVLGEEVDIPGLKRAIEAPRPAEVPLSEADGSEQATLFDGEGESGGRADGDDPDDEEIEPEDENADGDADDEADEDEDRDAEEGDDDDPRTES
jgi:segregation and condensation protein B